MINRIQTLIINELQEIIQEEHSYRNDLLLFGKGGILDSMNLVTLVVAMEEVIEEEYDVNIILADERAMSRSQSPFRTLESFGEYILELLREEGLDG